MKPALAGMYEAPAAFSVDRSEHILALEYSQEHWQHLT